LRDETSDISDIENMPLRRINNIIMSSSKI
jgi:hypothetical protein